MGSSSCGRPGERVNAESSDGASSSIVFDSHYQLAAGGRGRVSRPRRALRLTDARRLSRLLPHAATLSVSRRPCQRLANRAESMFSVSFRRLVIYRKTY